MQAQTDKQEDIKPITKEKNCEVVSVGQEGNRISEIFISCLFDSESLRCDGCMWITAVVFTRVRLTVRKRSCVLYRHRAINLFLKSYKKQWLETEEVDKNILITDLTVSTAPVHCGAEWCSCRPVVADLHMTVLLFWVILDVSALRTHYVHLCWRVIQAHKQLTGMLI